MSESKMARASLRKTAVYANELLSMIKPDSELEGWIQAKISELDHHIEAVYSYYKFGDSEEAEPYEEDKEESEDEESEDENKQQIVFVMPTNSIIP